MVENFFEIHIDLPRLRTAPALNLCEIQVTQINHDSFYEITKTFSSEILLIFMSLYQEKLWNVFLVYINVFSKSYNFVIYNLNTTIHYFFQKKIVAFWKIDPLL